MRIRSVKPEFWDDDTIGELPRDARLLFLATFNMADDEGLLRWTSAYVKAQAFMYDDDLSIVDVEALMTALTGAGLILPYSTSGKSRQRLAWIVNFRRHQKVNRPQPSKLTPPSIYDDTVVGSYGRRDKWTCHLCGGDLPLDTLGYACLDITLDHATPRSAGGTDHPTNMRAAHVGCRQARGGSPVDEFVTPAEVLEALASSAASLASDGDALSDAVNYAVSDSLNDVRQRVTEPGNLFTESEIRSLNGSVSDAPPEGKGEVREREGKTTSCVADATTETETPRPPTSKPKPAGELPVFDEFWDAYPRKIVKAEARKKFSAAVAKGADPKGIVEAAKAQAKQWRREGKEKQFVPHPATWLNQARYEDAVENSNLRLVSGGDSPWRVDDRPQSPWAQDMGWR